MTTLTNYEAETILTELRREELALNEADADVDKALANFRIAESRYIAIRDLARHRFGGTPYDMRFVGHWGSDIDGFFTDEDPTFGRYRFRGMKMGDAIIDHLFAAGARDLGEISVSLKDGGMVNADRRAVHAALLNTPGIVKQDDGKYSYRNAVVDDEDED